MILIGAYCGEYEGNAYAKLILTEPFESKNHYGTNAVISKCSVEFFKKIEREIDLYLNQPVLPIYDRFGRIISVQLT